MAKFAVVGYGSNGTGIGKKGEGYVYVVNDNVRTGDTIQPTVKHYKSGTIFGTTGVVLGKAGNKKNLTIKDANTGERVNVGEAIDAELNEKGIAPSYVATAKESGIKPMQGAGGRFVGGKSTHDAEGNYIAGTVENLARAKNIMARQAEEPGSEISKGKATQKAMETYAEYSAKFMGGQ